MPKHKGRTKHRNLFRPTGPDQLWETDITYIPTQRGMTYLMAIKDCFTKEWQGYNYSRSCLSRDAIRAVEDTIVKAFDGEVPEGLVLRVDNGPQYIARQFRSSMKLLRISLEYIQKHTLEDNGNIESFPHLTQDGLRLAIRIPGLQGRVGCHRECVHRLQ